MEWRCEWCGKPHEENDPPCDSCGHGSFEKAVVRQTDLGEDGHESMKMWVCTECGREHPKHSPPCSRCGGMSLERRAVSVDESALSTGGIREALGPRQRLALGVAVVLALVLAVGYFGVVELPGFSNSDALDVSNVPGNASTAGDESLATVEASYLDTLNQRRTDAGSASLDRVSGIDELATYYNQRWVKAEHSDGSVSASDIAERLTDQCDRTPTLNAFRTEGNVLGNADPGETVVELRLDHSPQLASMTASRTGIDVHVAPNGRLFVTQILC